MCLSCLQHKLASIAEYDKEISKHLEQLNCSCCASYPAFLKHVNMGLKVVCLAKMKKHEQFCPNGIRHITKMEEMTKQKIKSELAEAMEQLDEVANDLCEGKYLDKANQLKALHSFLEELDDAEHR